MALQRVRNVTADLSSDGRHLAIKRPLKVHPGLDRDDGKVVRRWIQGKGGCSFIAVGHQAQDSACPSCGSVRTMRTTIDRAGRVVIPHALRSRVGLAGGGEVEIQLDGAAIRIQAVAGTELREDGGLLVIPKTGQPVDDALVRDLVDADRHGR